MKRSTATLGQAQVHGFRHSPMAQSQAVTLLSMRRGACRASCKCRPAFDPNQTPEVAEPCQPVLYKSYNAGRSSFCVSKGTAKHA
jgi:hypothetical protein